MGTSHVEIVKFLAVFEPELTQVYVAVRDLTPYETPVGVAGWHHKTFSAKTNLPTILQRMAKGDDPLLWPLEAPP